MGSKVEKMVRVWSEMNNKPEYTAHECPKKGQLTLDDFSGPDGFERYLEYLEEDREAELLREVAIQIAQKKGTVTADDLRRFVEENGIPISKDYRVFGAVLASLKRKGILEVVGYTKTEVPSSHGRPIAVFALKGRR